MNGLKITRLNLKLPVHVSPHLPKDSVVVTANGYLTDSMQTMRMLVRAMNRAQRSGWYRINGGYRCLCGRARNTLRSIQRHRRQAHA